MAAAVRACLNLGKEVRLSPLVELVRHFASKAQPDFIEPGFDFGRPMFGPHYGITDSPIQSDGLPLYVDWFKVPGIMGKPFNQGCLGICFICGPLYGCSCVNSLATYDTTKEEVVLSVQHVLDCNTVSLGTATGGYYWDVFDFAVSNGGILSRSVYPFTGKGRGICKYREGEGVSIDGWMRVRPNCQLSMRYALAHQPVVIAVKMGDTLVVDGVEMDYLVYKKGTIKSPGYKTNANHCMVLYGYGEDEKCDPKWDGINSYGPSWGQGGKCQIARGTRYMGDSLGVLNLPAVPLKLTDSNGIVTSRSQSCPVCFKPMKAKILPLRMVPFP